MRQFFNDKRSRGDREKVICLNTMRYGCLTNRQETLTDHRSNTQAEALGLYGRKISHSAYPPQGGVSLWW